MSKGILWIKNEADNEARLIGSPRASSKSKKSIKAHRFVIVKPWNDLGESFETDFFPQEMEVDARV